MHCSYTVHACKAVYQNMRIMLIYLIIKIRIIYLYQNQIMYDPYSVLRMEIGIQQVFLYLFSYGFVKQMSSLSQMLIEGIDSSVVYISDIIYKHLESI